MNHRSFASRQIGDFLVTVLSDGNMAASLDLLSGIDTAEAGEIQRVTGITDPGHIQINSYLIRGQGRTILVDSGTGGLNNAGGLLRENLRATGIQPEDVDTILLTHGHPATTLIGGQIAGYSCKSAATPFVPYFVSSLDALVWRSGLPEGLYPEALIPGQRELGSQAGANMWGTSIRVPLAATRSFRRRRVRTVLHGSGARSVVAKASRQSNRRMTWPRPVTT
ncbi:MBL fold metallo-hydrolase [Rahnella perminowiae]|uniref:MBL fold metallo-hydrolase n=1 Tax=Rahnella perminowiae TaxID=2816244 RepID=UPI00215D5BD2|nr:MBL fold metallo-hydrolase [Rahnella perminowiae]MCR9001767.1 MBL fold metallo-hydrolase [Rahnella perminowiae]